MLRSVWNTHVVRLGAKGNETHLEHMWMLVASK